MARYKGAASEAGRAMHLMKKREKQMEQMEQRITEENIMKSNIDKKFSAHYDAVEAELQSSTVGLVTLNDMKAKQEVLVKEREKELAKREQSKELQLKKKIGSERNFGRNGRPSRRRSRVRHQDVQTNIIYTPASVGLSLRRVGCGGIAMKKGNTMQQFLQKALEILQKDFSELRSAGVKQLMYIKEDLIIPHHHSFYDFIVTKARGKSGPLFNFDVHDDVRLLSDATVKKDESHAGKVVLRRWYEKNKHIFPANRWEPYDPEKKWEKYTIR
ncbi:protein FAM50A isoform X4 [Petaurus breviceps papuanus]|uniref:protein FAM50A isoform X4 n=1 Tax=Petaurus breviceps papuanus TaxID=3040969 RepID=UPI0036DA5B2C